MCKEKDQDKKKRLIEECKRIRNELTNATRTSKKAYYDQYFSNNINNLKNMWRGIKEIINIKYKNHSSPLCVQNDKGKLVDSPQDIANAFIKYYSSIADDILSKRKYPGSKKFFEYLKTPNINSLSLYECDHIEVEAVIASFNVNKKQVQIVYRHPF